MIKYKKIKIMCSEEKSKKKIEKRLNKIKGKIINIQIKEKEVELKSGKTKKEYECFVFFEKRK